MPRKNRKPKRYRQPGSTLNENFHRSMRSGQAVMGRFSRDTLMGYGYSGKYRPGPKSY